MEAVRFVSPGTDYQRLKPRLDALAKTRTGTAGRGTDGTIIAFGRIAGSEVRQEATRVPFIKWWVPTKLVQARRALPELPRLNEGWHPPFDERG